MGRRRSRMSRWLMGVMVLTVGTGGAIWYARSGEQEPAMAATQAPRQLTGATPIAPAGAAEETADPLVTSAPLPAAIPPAAPAAASASTPAAQAAPAPAPATTGTAAAPVAVTADAPAALVEAKAKIDAGDLVEGRQMLNAALLSGRLSSSDGALARQLIAEASKTLVFSPRRFAADPYQGTHTVQPGEVLQKIAAAEGVTWEYLCRINGLSDPRRMRAGATLKTIQGPFHAVVTKGTYAMDIYLGAPGGAGSMYVTTLPVGLGANDSTPTGTWIAAGKLKNPAYFSPRGEGVIAADDPSNPLGEFWIGLQGTSGDAVGMKSYGIHGTIEPETIGTQSSLGCIRLKAEDIALVYELLVEGKSQVVVRE